MKKILLDTCILIDFFRRKPEALRYIEELESLPTVSAMTVAELYAGFRGPKELQELTHFLSKTEVLHVTAEIAQQGGLYKKQYHPSHGTDIVDAIIAATGKAHNVTVVTRNTKHFSMIETVRPY